VLHRNKTARQKDFAVAATPQPQARSIFAMRQTRKQAFNASEIIPIMVEEVIPGDVWSHTESIMARLATPIAPALDDLTLETFYFYIANRQLDVETRGARWESIITGIQQTVGGPYSDTPTTNIVPTMCPGLVNAPGSSYNWNCEFNSVADYMGIPPGIHIAPRNAIGANQAHGWSVTAFPIWGYLQIYNEFFRDQNLQQPWDWWTSAQWTELTDAPNQFNVDITRVGGGTAWDGKPLRANKRHDYFTSALPWPQKGDPVTIAVGTTAPVIPTQSTPGSNDSLLLASHANNTDIHAIFVESNDLDLQWGGSQASGARPMYWPTQTNLQVDLTGAALITINQLREGAVVQQMLETDARGGSRYVENILGHFGVRVSDMAAQRPIYLGGSRYPVTVNPIAQTAGYSTIQPGDEDSALGNLGAEMHASGFNRTFKHAITEHGYIIGVIVARATPTYQQGVRRHWIKRHERLDYAWPELAHLGEQTIDTKEIWNAQTATANTNEIWGYQERFAEMRYTPNEITGYLRSTAPQPMDWWHYAEDFATEPTLSDEFIQDKTKETLGRSLATAPNEQWSSQIIMDILHQSNVARLLPTYSTPGISRI